LPSRTAIISAVCPNSGSRASTVAPRSSSTRSAAGDPVRAAVINAVSPPGSAAIRIDTGVEQASNQVGIAVDGREVERCHTVAIRGRRFRTRTQQRVRDVQTIGMHGGMQRGHAVDARRVDVDLLSDERAYSRKVAASRRVNERRRRFGRSCRCGQ
jgi:hypothetical protein